jgi:hypothetical protein
LSREVATAAGRRPIWITCTFTPRNPFMIDSLAEHVVAPVSTYTRERFRAGNGWPVLEAL